MSAHRTSGVIPVPTADGGLNNTVADVVGNKTDTSQGKSAVDNDASLMNITKASYYHVHAPAKIYPDLADPVTITSGGGGAWELGAKTQVIPASTIGNPFDIHWVVMGNISAIDDYVLVLYKGAAASEVEIGRIGFVRDAIFAQEGNQPIQIPVQAADERISAALACGDGDGASCDIKLYYHEYPD